MHLRALLSVGTLNHKDHWLAMGRGTKCPLGSICTHMPTSKPKPVPVSINSAAPLAITSPEWTAMRQTVGSGPWRAPSRGGSTKHIFLPLLSQHMASCPMPCKGGFVGQQYRNESLTCSPVALLPVTPHLQQIPSPSAPLDAQQATDVYTSSSRDPEGCPPSVSPHTNVPSSVTYPSMLFGAAWATGLGVKRSISHCTGSTRLINSRRVTPRKNCVACTHSYCAALYIAAPTSFPSSTWRVTTDRPHRLHNVSEAFKSALPTPRRRASGRTAKLEI
mmetsp:Transcript_136570/g.237070  ORF Transcript_136570/g.237070 Transcript_136570/m.237070 type:complete len:276 (-) Transcript_136570:1226-2053(-)